MGERMRGAMVVGAVALVVGAVGMSGCSTAPFAPGQDPVAGAQYPKVVLEGALSRWIVVDYPSVVVDAPTAERPLAVTVPVRSTANTTEMAVQYKVRWLDDAGREVGESNWRTVRISPRWQDRFTANAMTTQATDWRMEIRVAR